MATFTYDEQLNATRCTALKDALVQRLRARKADQSEIDHILARYHELDLPGLQKAEDCLNKNEALEATQKAATAAANRLPTDLESMDKITAIRERKREEEKRRKGV